MRPWPRTQRRLGTAGFGERGCLIRLPYETSARGRSRGDSQPDTWINTHPVRSASSSARVLEPVAEEEVAAVQASGEELPAESARGKEARALDQPEVGLECRAAGEERRDGQKELVDEPRRGERPEEGRPRFAQDPLVSARV